MNAETFFKDLFNKHKEEVKEFKVWNISRFVRIKNAKKVEHADFPVLPGHHTCHPPQADAVWKGQLHSSKIFEWDCDTPVSVGDWKPLPPLNVIVAVKGKDVSIYTAPIGGDFRYEIGRLE